jgi:hypothetical protein
MRRNNGMIASDEELVVDVIGHQLEHFRHAETPCRGMELPDGIILRHTLSESLFFYVRTRVEDGKIKTQVFASDSPYDRQKASIASIITPMFEPRSELTHVEELETLVRNWVEFVHGELDSGREFQLFEVNP